MNVLRLGFLVCLSLPLSHFAAASCEDIVGDYVNPALNGRFNHAEVLVTRESKKTTVFELRIPCGTKMTPTVLYASCEDGLSGYYEQVFFRENGGSQCSVGEHPRILIIGDKLTILTDIRVPGFNGQYEFTREAPAAN